MCSLNIFEHMKGVLYYEKINCSNAMAESFKKSL